jgi:hypothetical protein
MKFQSWPIYLGLIVIVFLFGASCSSDSKSTNPEGGDPGGTQSGTHMVAGSLGAVVMTNGQFTLLVERVEPEAPGSNDLTVTFEGETLTPIGINNATTAGFEKHGFNYTAGQEYNVTVSGGGISSSCDFTGPVFNFPTIEYPAQGSSFVLGQDIDVAWNYDTNPTTDVYLHVYANGSEESVIYEATIEPRNSTAVIPGSVTANHSEYTSLIIQVDGGTVLWPFEGDLAFTGSNMVAILPGVANEIFSTAGDQYTVSLDPSPNHTTLNADGTSTAQLVASVRNETQGTNMQGVEITFAVDPPGALSFSPNPVRMAEASSEAHTTVTAGTAAGTATVTARYSYTDSAPLTYTLTEPFTVTVGAGPNADISWTPTSPAPIVFAVSATNGLLGWSVGSLSGIQPPVTYGTLPAGCNQVWPPGGGSPGVLVAGVSYTIAMTFEGGSIEYHTFTAQ